MAGILRVRMGSTDVGTIKQLSNGGHVFAFERSYLNKSDKPTLGQGFFVDDGQLRHETRAYRNKPPPFFSNLLPEGALRKFLADEAGIREHDEFHLLSFLGSDLPGNVQIEALNAKTNHAGMSQDNSKSKAGLHFSLAGVQLKFSAMGTVKGGLTVPANGVGGSWIAKFPSPYYANVPQNEFSIMTLAAQIGIPVPEIALVPIDQIANLPMLGVMNETEALVVKRFDRDDAGNRVHMEDFAQVYNIFPEKKYEGVSYANLARDIFRLTGEQGLSDFVRRLVFSVLTGNGDMHLKNWSLLYPDGVHATLSPAYDLLSTIPYLPRDKLSLNLGKTKDMMRVGLLHFRKLSDRVGVSEALVVSLVRETVEATREAWLNEGKNFPLDTRVYQAIDDFMRAQQLWTEV